ncbi:BTBD7-like protein [Mya arenaria]|uniref:BTBD7-like protein n=1 Tax=Mya arenaria TaxID=6604 RepID=A0ABY7FDE7_MYAAR|nr:BTBD7-like protein [Mya arenaria]
MGTNASFPEATQSCAGSPTKLQGLSRLTQSYTVSDSDLSNRDKKKKTSKFATLRKKLTRARRHSKSLDYGKAMRDLVSSWSTHDLASLVQQYESLASLKELCISSNIARSAASTYAQDLSHLYDFKYCTDIEIVYKGVCFPAHRALLCARSPFFRDILSRHHDTYPRVPIKLRTPGVDVVLFSALLHYLYSDSINFEELSENSRVVLTKLATELGMPNPLYQDLRNLLESGDYSDSVLVFTSEPDMNESFSSETGSSEGLSRANLELQCHRAVLAARSPFFRNLLIRRAQCGEDNVDHSQNFCTRIVLDESVIPRRYARVLLHALYLDTVDLSLIMRGSASVCSLSEVQAIVAGRGQMTAVDEAMEIYQIGQFLDIPAISQGCEDVMVEQLSVENLVSVLAWSEEPHGSPWVLRHALHYLREEFLQAGELDVLGAVIRWGEHHLVRRIEKREPNLLSHTAHSVSRKGVKRRDMNDVELRDIMAEVLPLVRMDHVIPYTSEILTGAIRRGLVSVPPTHMLTDETGHTASAWVPGRNNAVYTRPRLFTPYYEEGKSLLEERQSCGQGAGLSRVRPLHMSSIPDTLYMVDDPQYLHHFLSAHPVPLRHVDIVSGTIPAYLDRRAVMYQLHLRVVREFGWPDSTVEVLQNVQYYYNREPPPQRDHPTYADQSYPPLNPRRRPSPPPRQECRHRSQSRQTQHITPASSPTKHYNQGLCEFNSGSDGSEEDFCSGTLTSQRSALSDTMPDIAMATASASQLHLGEENQPDIGDGGAGRHGMLYI